MPSGAKVRSYTDGMHVSENGAVDAAVLDEELLHGRVRPDLRAEVLRRATDRAGDGAHATLRIAPLVELPVAEVSDGVVHQYIGRAGLLRARPGSDDAVGRERGDHLARLEPLREQIRAGHREELREVGDPAPIETVAEAERELQLLHEVARRRGT